MRAMKTALVVMMLFLVGCSQPQAATDPTEGLKPALMSYAKHRCPTCEIKGTTTPVKSHDAYLVSVDAVRDGKTGLVHVVALQFTSSDGSLYWNFTEVSDEWMLATLAQAQQKAEIMNKVD